MYRAAMIVRCSLLAAHHFHQPLVLNTNRIAERGFAHGVAGDADGSGAAACVVDLFAFCQECTGNDVWI